MGISRSSSSVRWLQPGWKKFKWARSSLGRKSMRISKPFKKNSWESLSLYNFYGELRISRSTAIEWSTSTHSLVLFIYLKDYEANSNENFCKFLKELFKKSIFSFTWIFPENSWCPIISVAAAFFILKLTFVLKEPRYMKWSQQNLFQSRVKPKF